MDLNCSRSDENGVLVCHGEERGEHESKASNLPVDLHPYRSLWSWALGSDKKKNKQDHGYT